MAIKEFNDLGETVSEKQIRDEALIYITQATAENKESYYRVKEDLSHLQKTDFINWIKKIFSNES